MEILASGPMLLTTLHRLSPAVVTVAYIIASLAHFFGRKKTEQNVGSGKSLRLTCVVITILVLATFVFESILLISVLPSHAALFVDETLVFTLFSSLAWLLLFLGSLDHSPSDIRRISSAAWTLALFFDIGLLILDIFTPKLAGAAKIFRLFFQATRIALLLALVGIAFGQSFTRRAEKSSDEEIAPLLARFEGHLQTSGAHHMNGNAYGGTTADDSKNATKTSDQPTANDEDGDEDEDDEDEDNASKGKLKKDWWVYTKAFAIFLPHLWPKKSLKLQLHFPALGLCLLVCRALNVFVPLQLGYIIDSFRENGNEVPWAPIAIFVLLRFLDSSAGISLLQSWLWMPINRYTTEELSAAAFNQILDLSSDFHDSKKSGKVWRVVGRGEALTDLVYTIAFEMVPMAADLVIAVSVFWLIFDAYMAFIVALASVLFLWSTAKTIPLKTERQREYIKAWENEYNTMTESTLNWTTVSYFNRIGYEQARYKDAVSNSQSKMIRYRIVSNITKILRALTLQTGLMMAAMLNGYQISQGHRRVGDFVVLITYWAQLTVPLAFFANGFSRIAKSLVDAEKLLELLETKPTVGNHVDATEFVLKQGQVDFDRVCFSYDGQRKISDNLSFRAEPGQTIALVGETGGGKSTILKLLFRFYDTTSGTVMIDGQDVKLVTMESLRANIGCVPQEPVLFNQTILQNLRYAKLNATEEEVQAACKAVALHDKIMTFTKGYSEKVGERGVKLSGGELQRMAIARVILQDPKILLLDEATSSVDSETEAIIQDSLKKLCAGRTTFVIAHRLSTIVSADVVMVIKNGRIIERGSHDKLMQVFGHYRKLWSRQLRLQTGDEDTKSRSRSPEKTTVLVDDVTDSELEVSKSLPKKHEDRGSEEVSGADSDRTKVAEPTIDAKARGRSPLRNDKAWKKFDKMRNKILTSRSPQHKDQDASLDRRSQSHSPIRTSLKPQAPEFVPRNLQGDVPYLSHSTGTSENAGEYFPSGTRAGLFRAASEGKENLLGSSAPSVTQSTPALSTLTEGKLTRFGFSIPTGQRRNRTSTTDQSAMNSSTELPLPDPRKTNRKRSERKSKQVFNSRRSISKSEPQARHQMDGIAENEVDGESASYPGPVQREGDMSTRRRSSAPDETPSGVIAHQDPNVSNIYRSQPHKSDRGAG
jgi:ABC-type transport system involved in Fe-S cluster assembly fused permease/ATPase subunit